MDPKEAYQKVKEYIHQWKEDDKVFQMGDAGQAQEMLKDPAKMRERAKSLRSAQEKHLIYWNAPRQWPQVEREALARLAGSDEPMEYRGSAIALIGHCHMREFTDLLVRILQHDRDGGARQAAATSLGALGVRDTLPFLYYGAIDSSPNKDEYHKWFGQFCVQGIYHILFQFWPDSRKYGTGGSLDAAYMMWWEKNRPSEELLFAWSRGEHLPEDDGFGNPKRDDVKYADMYDLQKQLQRMHDAWTKEDARGRDDVGPGMN